MQIDSSEPSRSEPVRIAVALALEGDETRYDISNVSEPPGGMLWIESNAIVEPSILTREGRGSPTSRA